MLNGLTKCRLHSQIANRAVEEHQRQALLIQLINGRLVDTVASGLEVTTGNDFEGVANVDDQRSGVVWGVVPLLVLAPDLKA